MEFSIKLKNLMVAHRFSQQQLAEKLDISNSLVSNWTKGKGEPSMRELLTLARLLQVPLDYLADDTIDDPRKAGRTGLDPEDLQVLDSWRLLRRGGMSGAEAVLRLAGPMTRREQGFTPTPGPGESTRGEPKRQA